MVSEMQNLVDVSVTPELSVVVPLYNEADSVRELHARLTEQLRLRGATYEIVLVDDGSRDLTYQQMREVHAADPGHVRLVRLRRNFGQTAGLAAGLDHARGKVIITMDGDLQHDPSDLPRFFAKIDEGYELVSGWRERRVDGLLLRRIPSKVANWAMSRLTGIPLHDFGTTYKAYRREILEGLELHGELHRFVPALLSWQGVSICEIPITNIPRPHGQSNYGISRTFRVLFDLLTVKFLVSYISRPLHVFGLTGMLLFGAGFAIALLLTCGYYLGWLTISDHLGNLMLALLLMVLGVQLVSTGLVMEVMIRTYHAAAGRKIYAVREVVEPVANPDGSAGSASTGSSAAAGGRAAGPGRGAG